MTGTSHAVTNKIARSLDVKKQQKNDHKFPELSRSDVSIYPSYTNLKFAYDVICRQRYNLAKLTHSRQFMDELLLHERLQNKALDGVRLHREFSLGVLSHKIPPRRNMNDPLSIKYTSKKIGHKKLIN